MVSSKIVEKTEFKQSEADLAALKKVLLSKAELSIWLDSYEDIFSDFDSRPYHERALSDDFIHEVQKMAKEKTTGHIQLTLLMPSRKREKNTEELIVKSLHSHFRFFAQQQYHDFKQIKKRGILLSFTGVIILTGAAYLVNLPVHSFFLNILRITLEPFGLFMVWTGLEAIFYKASRKKPEFDFNSKMARADIQFLSI